MQINSGLASLTRSPTRLTLRFNWNLSVGVWLDLKHLKLVIESNLIELSYNSRDRLSKSKKKNILSALSRPTKLRCNWSTRKFLISISLKFQKWEDWPTKTEAKCQILKNDFKQMPRLASSNRKVATHWWASCENKLSAWDLGLSELKWSCWKERSSG